MFANSAIVALFAGLVAAQHAPVGKPDGNPITRPLNEVVPACTPFTITWQPTTPNQVSLVLLRGPSTNVVPISTIVTGLSNSGSFVWTPPASLEADVTHYGLQLIDDVTGQFQYSTQFGISKGKECDGYKPASSSSTVYGGGYPASTPASISKATPSASASKSEGYPVSVPVSSKVANTTIVTKTSSVVLSTGGPVYNSSIIQPTKPLTVPGSLLHNATASATGPGLPESTGAAAGLRAGFGLMGAAVAAVFML